MPQTRCQVLGTDGVFTAHTFVHKEEDIGLPGPSPRHFTSFSPFTVRSSKVPCSINKQKPQKQSQISVLAINSGLCTGNWESCDRHPLLRVRESCFQLALCFCEVRKMEFYQSALSSVRHGGAYVQRDNKLCCLPESQGVLGCSWYTKTIRCQADLMMGSAIIPVHRLGSGVSTSLGDRGRESAWPVLCMLIVNSTCWMTHSRRWMPTWGSMSLKNALRRHSKGRLLCWLPTSCR